MLLLTIRVPSKVYLIFLIAALPIITFWRIGRRKINLLFKTFCLKLHRRIL